MKLREKISGGKQEKEKRGQREIGKPGSYERTNLSRLTQLGFLGLYFMMRLNRTWAAGAIPLEKKSSSAMPDVGGY
jgi:hypothetical protein